jgi:3,4-dihydroxyphthalate decarboxylase
MAAVLGDRPVVLLRGHGLTSTAASVPEAVLQAMSADRLARLALAVVAAGGVLRDLPAQDLAELPDLGAGLTTDIAWRHELARLE